jgi:hypothetical protein
MIVVQRHLRPVLRTDAVADRNPLRRVNHATDFLLDARRQHFRTADGSIPTATYTPPATGPKVAGALVPRSERGVSRIHTHARRIGAPGRVLALKHGEHGSRVPVRIKRLDLALVIHLNDIDAIECD